jgi:2-hydroxychromene-2-carboxylate isomerase
LIELLPQFPDIDVVWRPCESHPRPERHGLHSDLCIMGMFYVLEISEDICKYHELMYDSALVNKTNIEDPLELSKRVSSFIESENFYRAVAEGRYAKDLHDSNVYAFVKSGVWAVPAYRMDGKKLDSIEGIGVTKKQLEDFLKNKW